MQIYQTDLNNNGLFAIINYVKDHFTLSRSGLKVSGLSAKLQIEPNLRQNRSNKINL